MSPDQDQKASNGPNKRWKWLLKSILFSLFLWKFLSTLKLKKYHFSVKIAYEHAATYVTWKGREIS
jgi:hypothetical protein